MKLENQVCTLDQAKKLQELGVLYKEYQYAYVDFETREGQEAVLCRPALHFEEYSREWSWFMVGNYSESIQAELDEDTVNADGGIYPAFTVAELGMMLPHFDNLSQMGGFVHLTEFDPSVKDDKPWYCLWEYDRDKENAGFGREIIDGITEAQARAAMLIFCLERLLITPEQVNQRLTS